MWGINSNVPCWSLSPNTTNRSRTSTDNVSTTLLAVLVQFPCHVTMNTLFLDILLDSVSKYREAEKHQTYTTPVPSQPPSKNSRENVVSGQGYRERSVTQKNTAPPYAWSAIVLFVPALSAQPLFPQWFNGVLLTIERNTNR